MNIIPYRCILGKNQNTFLIKFRIKIQIKAHLTSGTHHSGRFNTSELSCLDQCITKFQTRRLSCRHMCTIQSDRYNLSRFNIMCTGNNLNGFAASNIDLAD